MSDRTGIEWTDATWNPIRGCSRVSAGCQHCYAETVAGRFCGPGQPYEGLIHAKTKGWNGTVKLAPEALQIPWRWTRPRRIFVNSMSDLFHEDVPFEFIAAVFFVMSATTRHTYHILTKRPERMLAFFDWLVKRNQSEDLEFLYILDGFNHQCVRSAMNDSIRDAAHTIEAINALGWKPTKGGRGGYDNCGPSWPYENVWLGVSVENQATADERIPLLLRCPAAVHWISAEPLLGPVDLRAVAPESWDYGTGTKSWDALKGEGVGRCGDVEHSRVRGFSKGIDWVVAGGESGTGARPMHPDWARSLRDQCSAAGVPFLFKQHGGWWPITRTDGIHQLPFGEYLPHATPPFGFIRKGKKAAGRLLDGVQHDDYPEISHG